MEGIEWHGSMASPATDSRNPQQSTVHRFAHPKSVTVASLPNLPSMACTKLSNKSYTDALDIHDQDPMIISCH